MVVSITGTVDNFNRTRTKAHALLRAILLLALAGLFSCSGGAGNGRPDKQLSNARERQPQAEGIAPTATVSTARPLFSWPALPGATRYHLMVEDDYNNHYQQTVLATDAGCDGESATCSTKPAIAYYNQSLSWWVDAVVDGETVALTSAREFITPADVNFQPVTDNASVCDVWPALGYENFAVLNNIWNAGTMRSDSWSQTISARQASDNSIVASWNYNWLAQKRGAAQEVKAYPEVIYGNKLGTLVTGSKADTGLPERIDKLATFMIDYRYSETGNAERNVAIESFFHESCNITGPCHHHDNRAYEMMVWINNPKTWRPGDLARKAVEIDGLKWDVYIKPRSNKRYIAFAVNTPQTEGEINWNRFVDWTVNWTTANAAELGISPMTPDLCMGAIEFGTELWSGSGSFALEKLDIRRQ